MAPSGRRDREERRAFDIVKADWERYVALHQRIRQMQDSGQMAEARHLFMGEGVTLYATLSKSVGISFASTTATPLGSPPR